MKLRSIVLLYSACLTVVFILAAISLAAGIRLPPPEDTQKLYISFEGAALTENGLTVPLEEFDRRSVTAREISSTLLPYYNRLAVILCLAALAAALLLSLLFAIILTRRLIRPLEETAERLRRPDRRAGVWSAELPPELAGIAAALEKAEAETAKIRGELENMSSYISHDQKNSLALQRAPAKS